MCSVFAAPENSDDRRWGGATMPTFSFDFHDGEYRLGELMLYFSQECAGDASYGATKLNKMLWLADFVAYARHGEPITGVEYQRLKNGPAPRRLPPVRDALIADGSAEEAQVQRGRYQQKRLIARRDPDTSFMSDHQTALVDEVIKATRGASAKAISQWSHGFAWKAAGADREPIPYEAAFLSNKRINDSDVSKTQKLAARFGWALA